MTITSIEKTKRGRYALLVDGQFLFSIHRDSYLKTALAVGQSLTVEQLETLRVGDQLLSAKQSALDALAARAHSSGDLLAKLLRHYDAEAAEAAVERMTQLGLIDDADYARRLASDCQKLRGYSLLRTRQQLLQKKLPRELVDETMAALTEATDETDPIVALLQKKYRNKLDTPDDRRRTVAALQRRGFRYEDIRTALRRYGEELPGDDE